MSHKRGFIVAITAAGLALLAACGSTTPAANTTSTSTSTSTSSPTSSSPTSTSTESSSMTSETSGADTSGPVGPGCAAYAKANATGAGSIDGMAAAPVASAAAGNPLLTTLVAAVSGKVNPKVDLVSTLNGGEFTVFAPVDEAFKMDVDAATLTELTTNADLLSTILTYHVLPGQLAPDAIVGTHKTVEGEELTVAGTADKLTVNGNAMVICGGVKTANATVYLIDHVLLPPTVVTAMAGAMTGDAMTSSTTS